MMPWQRTRWPLALALAAAGLGLIGGLAWALRPRAEAETAALARRSLREATHQLDLFLQTYPTAPGEARGALQRAPVPHPPGGGATGASGFRTAPGADGR
jgi:hypothetical protein